MQGQRHRWADAGIWDVVRAEGQGQGQEQERDKRAGHLAVVKVEALEEAVQARRRIDDAGNNSLVRVGRTRSSLQAPGRRPQQGWRASWRLREDKRTPPLDSFSAQRKDSGGVAVEQSALWQTETGRAG